MEFSSRIKSRPNKYHDIGVRGRKTGWMPKKTIRKDVNGLDDIDDFFASSSEEEQIIEEYHEPQQRRNSSVRPIRIIHEEEFYDNLSDDENTPQYNSDHRKNHFEEEEADREYPSAPLKPQTSVNVARTIATTPHQGSSSVLRRKDIEHHPEFEYRQPKSVSRTRHRVSQFPINEQDMPVYEVADTAYPPGFRRQSYSVPRSVRSSHQAIHEENYPVIPRSVMSKPSSKVYQDSALAVAENRRYESPSISRRKSLKESQIVNRSSPSLIVPGSSRKKSGAYRQPTTYIRHEEPVEYLVPVEDYNYRGAQVVTASNIVSSSKKYAQQPIVASSPAGSRRRSVVRKEYVEIEPNVYETVLFETPVVEEEPYFVTANHSAPAVVLTEDQDLRNHYIGPIPMPQRSRRTSMSSAKKPARVNEPPHTQEIEDELPRATKARSRRNSYVPDDEVTSKASRRSSLNRLVVEPSVHELSIDKRSRRNSLARSGQQTPVPQVKSSRSFTPVSTAIIAGSVEIGSANRKKITAIPEDNAVTYFEEPLDTYHYPIDVGIPEARSDESGPEEPEEMQAPSHRRSRNHAAKHSRELVVRTPLAECEELVVLEEPELQKKKSKKRKAITQRPTISNRRNLEEEEDLEAYKQKYKEMIARSREQIPSALINYDGRPQRQRIKPVKFWENERVEYKYVRDATINDRVAIMTRYLPPVHQSPVKRPKRTTHTSKRQQHTSSHVSAKSSASRLIEYEPVEEKELEQQTEVSEIPVLNHETGKEEEKPVVITPSMVIYKDVDHQAFKFSKTFSEGSFLASGILIIPKNAQKPNKNSKDAVMLFMVLKGVVSVTIHRTTFKAGAGTQFAVPRGNQYKIVNDGDAEAKLFFVHGKEIIVDKAEQDKEKGKNA